MTYRDEYVAELAAELAATHAVDPDAFETALAWAGIRSERPDAEIVPEDFGHPEGWDIFDIDERVDFNFSDEG